MKQKKHLAALLLIFILGLFGSRALFHSGLYTAHDIWHQVARLYWYQQSLSSGSIPPSWVMQLANGFGYPLFLFSYSLPWIAAFPFLWSGIDVVTSIKLLFIFSFVLSGLTMYWFSFEVFKSKVGAVVAAVIYMYAPYHFLQLLVSAAMGRMFVFVFTPLLFLSVYFLGNSKDRNKGVFLFCLSFLGLTLSHLISFVALFPVLFLFSLWVRAKVKPLLTSSLISLGLSAFYVLPAALYSGLTLAKTGSFSYLYKSGFINFKQLIYSPWGYGTIVHDAREGVISYQLGFAGWTCLALITITLFVFKLKPVSKQFVYFVLLSSSLSIFLMLPYSRPVWDFITKFISLDYPTMFLVPLVFVTSISGAFIVSNVRVKVFAFIFSIALIFLCFINTRNYMRVNMYTDFPLQTYIDSETTTSSFGEYFPTGFDQKLLNTPKEVMVFEPNTAVEEIVYSTNYLSFKLINEVGQDITIRHISFPGITLYVDDKREDYSTNKNKLITKYFKKGEYRILIKYEKTSLMRVSIIISAISLILLIAMCNRKKIKPKI